MFSKPLTFCDRKKYQGSIDRSIERFIERSIDPNWKSINVSRLDGQSPSPVREFLFSKIPELEGQTEKISDIIFRLFRCHLYVNYKRYIKDI